MHNFGIENSASDFDIAHSILKSLLRCFLPEKLKKINFSLLIIIFVKTRCPKTLSNFCKHKKPQVVHIVCLNIKSKQLIQGNHCKTVMFSCKSIFVIRKYLEIRSHELKKYSKNLRYFVSE